MAKTTAQERRAAAREQRRGSAAEEATVAIETDPADALRAAASAAIAGAAVGAARAFARRRSDDDHGEGEAEAQHQVEEEEDEEPVEPAAAEDEPAAAEEEPQPVAPGDAKRIVERAREQLRDLHGAEAESVSAIHRTANGWRVGLEVVEVHRIPESTDVLATYEVEVDGDGDLLTFERTTRYYRSEADRR
ncbi:MAG: gas vesicle protein [Gaiellaceae bacterium]